MLARLLAVAIPCSKRLSRPGQSRLSFEANLTALCAVGTRVPEGSQSQSQSRIKLSLRLTAALGSIAIAQKAATCILLHPRKRRTRAPVYTGGPGAAPDWGCGFEERVGAYAHTEGGIISYSSRCLCLSPLQLQLAFFKSKSSTHTSPPNFQTRPTHAGPVGRRAPSPPRPRRRRLCAARAEMGAQLGSSVAFGSGCGQALPWVPRKAPLC